MYDSFKRVCLCQEVIVSVVRKLNRLLLFTWTVYTLFVSRANNVRHFIFITSACKFTHYIALGFLCDKLIPVYETISRYTTRHFKFIPTTSLPKCWRRSALFHHHHHHHHNHYFIIISSSSASSSSSSFRELTQPRRRPQRQLQKTIGLMIKKKNSSARASHF